MSREESLRRLPGRKAACMRMAGRTAHSRAGVYSSNGDEHVHCCPAHMAPSAASQVRASRSSPCGETLARSQPAPWHGSFRREGTGSLLLPRAAAQRCSLQAATRKLVCDGTGCKAAVAMHFWRAPDCPKLPFAVLVESFSACPCANAAVLAQPSCAPQKDASQRRPAMGSLLRDSPQLF